MDPLADDPLAPTQTESRSFLARQLMRLGLAKDERTANMILIGFAGALVLISLYLVLFGGSYESSYDKSQFAPPELSEDPDERTDD